MYTKKLTVGENEKGWLRSGMKQAKDEAMSSKKGNCKFWPNCKKGPLCEWKHGASANSEDLSERVKNLENMLSSKDPHDRQN